VVNQVDASKKIGRNPENKCVETGWDLINGLILSQLGMKVHIGTQFLADYSRDFLEKIL
jgi:hypothetical protein